MQIYMLEISLLEPGRKSEISGEKGALLEQKGFLTEAVTAPGVSLCWGERVPVEAPWPHCTPGPLSRSHHPTQHLTGMLQISGVSIPA